MNRWDSTDPKVISLLPRSQGTSLSFYNDIQTSGKVFSFKMIRTNHRNLRRLPLCLIRLHKACISSDAFWLQGDHLRITVWYEDPLPSFKFLVLLLAATTHLAGIFKHNLKKLAQRNKRNVRNADSRVLDLTSQQPLDPCPQNSAVGPKWRLFSPILRISAGRRKLRI